MKAFLGSIMKNVPLSVYPTEDRSKAGGDYIAVVSPQDAERHKLGRGSRVVIVYIHPNLTQKKEQGPPSSDSARYDNFSPDLCIPCRVLLDEKVPSGQIRVDQTLRNCLGIEYEFIPGHPKVEIYPLHLGLWERLTDLVSDLFGRRHLFFRVCRAHPPDMEKNICRIPQDSINILGAKEGESIVLTSIVREGHVFRRRNYMLNVFPISEDIKDGRNLEQRDEETDNPFVRYPRSDVILGVKPDISSIFLDFDARTELDVHCFDVVRAHHFLRTTLIREIRDFGLVFFLSLLALTDGLEKVFGLQTGGAVLFSFALSVVVIMIRIVLYFHAGIK